MWHLKAHYTLWFGSLSGVLPYVSIFARTHLEVTATTVGVLFCVLPFMVSIIKPIACSVADHYDNHLKALMVSQLLTLLGYGSLVIFPFVRSMISLSLLWYLFCLFTLISNTAMGTGTSITDYLVMNEVNIIKQHGGKTNYGNFRIWGTVGFGVFGKNLCSIQFSMYFNRHSVWNN